MSNAEFSDDDQDRDDDDQDQDDSDQDNGDPDSGAGSQTHRNFLGDALQHLSDRGIDVDSLAEKAGVDSADVDNLSQDDLSQLTQNVQQNHPDALQAVGDRYPQAQGILSSLGGGGGFLGKLFG